MSDPFARLRRFLSELKRRKVYRVAAVYAGVAFVVVQAANLVFPALNIPSWAYSLVVVLALLGFPMALVLAWAFEVTPEGVQRTSAEAGEAEAASMSPTARRAQSRFALESLVGLGVLGVAVAGGWYLMAGGGDSPDVSERTVAVLPFQVSGSGAEEWRDGMVSLLSTGLDGAAGLRAIADRTVFATWEQRGPGDAEATTQQALAVAREVGARYAIIGSAVALSEELRLTANVRNTSSGERVGQAAVRGSPDSVTSLADSLTRRILGLLLEESDEGLPSVDLASLTTSSLPALKSYLRGERHFRAGQYKAAIEDYQAAAEMDSTFALAFERMALSKAWIGESHHAEFRRVYQLADHLPVRERRLLSALYRWEVPILTMQAADSLRHLTRVYPDDPRSWYYLAEVLMHGHVPGGWPEAEEAFLRAIELDPGVASYHYHPVELTLSLHGDSALAARRIDAHPVDPRKEKYEALWSLRFGSAAQREEARNRLDSLPLSSAPTWAHHALDHPRDKDLQAQVFRRLSRRQPGVSYTWMLTRNHFDRGQIERGVHLLQELSEGDPSRLKVVAADRACLLAGSMSLGYPLPDSALRLSLEAPSPPSGTAFPTAWLRCSGIYRIEQGRGDELPSLFDRVRQVARQEIEDERVAASRAEAVIHDLRGYRAWKAGRLNEAARLWSGLKPSDGEWGAIWRGDLYRELGRREKAEDWYVAAWDHPVAHQRLGQLYEEMGRPEDAAAAYRRFIAAWEDADPELQDRVEAARKRLQALNGWAPEADE